MALPSDTGFERAGKKHYVSLKLEGQGGVRSRDLRFVHQGPSPVTFKSPPHDNKTQLQVGENLNKVTYRPKD